MTRAAGFTGPLTVSLETPLVSLHADPLTLNADQTTGTLDVKTDSSAPVTPVTARIVATSADNRRATTGFTLNLQ